MNKINKLYKVSVLTLLILFVGSACENGFEEMNRHPSSPTRTSASFLFNGMISNTPTPGDHILYIWSERAYQWSQLAAVRGGGGVDLNTGAIGETPNTVADRGRNQMWGRYFGMLRSYRALEDLLDNDIDQERIVNQRAMAYILYAYRTFLVTDLYGDIPYSEAGKGFTEGIPRPEYDTQEFIYRDLFDKLDWALNNMVMDVSNAATPDGNAYINYGSSETLYGNDMEMWAKFANSIKLRYGLRVQNADPGLAQSVVTSAMAGPLFEMDEGLIFGPGTARYSGWQWFAFGRMGTRIWSEVNGGIANPNPDGSDIVDPRLYGWFEQNRDFEWVPIANDWAVDESVSGHPTNDKRRAANDDIEGEYRAAHSGFNWYTVENGENSWDYQLDGKEVALMKAEAALLGWGASAGEAIAWYNEGVEASIRTYHEMPTMHNDWENTTLDYPELDEDDIVLYLTNPRYALNGTNDLAKVLRQRWLNYFFNTTQAWALVRRTDLIDLEPVNDVNGNPVPLAMRIPYPEDEPINNGDAYNAAVTRQGGDNVPVGMWWTK